MKIALFGNEFSSSYIKYINHLVTKLESENVEVIIHHIFHEFLQDSISFSEEIDCDTLNECLKKNYIIKSKMTFKPHETILNIIYELTKKRDKVLIHCIVKYRLSGTTRFKGSRCYKP